MNFKCYQVQTTNWEPAYMLAHSMIRDAEAQGVLWFPAEHLVVFQASDFFTMKDLELIVRFKTGSFVFSLNNLTLEDYEDAYSKPNVSIVRRII